MTQHEFPLEAAQVFATLAGIAYAGDTLDHSSPSIAELHAAINHQLSGKPHYATGIDWQLVWGPVESKQHDNLIFAAYNKSTETLALSLRGTTQQTLSRFEDVPRYFSAFPGPKRSEAQVSGPFLAGLKSVLRLADSWHSKTFAQFYADFTSHVPVGGIVVTGHSQGAALVPMMMLALQEGLIGSPKTENVKGFAIAPPTSGNHAFADIVNRRCDCWFVINPKDVVPLGYNAMSAIVTEGIPEELHGLERESVKLLIDGLNAYVHPSEWAQPTQRAILEGVTLTDEGFFAQISDQHNPNAYLAKLGANGIDVGNPSAFPKSNLPVIKIG